MQSHTGNQFSSLLSGVLTLKTIQLRTDQRPREPSLTNRSDPTKTRGAPVLGALASLRPVPWLIVQFPGGIVQTPRASSYLRLSGDVKRLRSVPLRWLG